MLWSVHQVSSAELVRAACDLLVAGHDGPDLAMLAGVSTRRADEEVPELLEAALHDVGLDYFPPGSSAGWEAAVRIMADRVLAGRMQPRDLAAWAHGFLGHGTLDLAERLVELDDVYGLRDIGYSDMTGQETDAEVVAEARRAVASATVPP